MIIKLKESYDDEYNDYRIKLIDGDFIQGEYVTVETSDGKQYRRKVFDSPDDLYILIKGYRYYYSDVI